MRKVRRETRWSTEQDQNGRKLKPGKYTRWNLIISERKSWKELPCCDSIVFRRFVAAVIRPFRAIRSSFSVADKACSRFVSSRSMAFKSLISSVGVAMFTNASHDFEERQAEICGRKLVSGRKYVHPVIHRRFWNATRRRKYDNVNCG